MTRGLRCRSPQPFLSDLILIRQATWDEKGSPELRAPRHVRMSAFLLRLREPASLILVCVHLSVLLIEKPRYAACCYVLVLPVLSMPYGVHVV